MLSEIKKHLSGHPWRDKIQYFNSLASTNTFAKELAHQGAPEGTVIIADHQTGGRGRLGRTFSSPAGMGIYLSVVLRPNCYPEELMHLTCATGVVACNAVETATGIVPKIKWTNDLVVGKRKLGGILTELSVNSVNRKVDWAVIGIGINCCQKSDDFPEEIQGMACSLGINRQDMPPLFATLIQSLAEMRRNLLTEKARTMAEFVQRCITIGCEISVLQSDNARHGKALDVDEDGGLVVQYDDGSIGTVSSGEVSIRGMYGYL